MDNEKPQIELNVHTARPKTFKVFVYAPGWNGNFELPQTCFKKLTEYLTRRSGKPR